MSEREHAEPSPTSERDPNISMVVVLGVISVVSVLVIFLGLEVLYYQTAESENLRKTIAGEPRRLSELEAAQLERLNGHHWVDREGGRVSIPIDQAMERLIAESARSRGPARSPGAAPAGATADPPAAEGARP